jgi:hypothetical protein
VKQRPYDANYRRLRQLLLDPPVQCAHCQRRRATTLDHDPPLAMHVHRNGTGCCRHIPSCEQCNRSGGLAVRHGTWRPDGWSPVEVDLPPERTGIPFEDKRWRVPWLKQLRRVPADAAWPRLMTVPHERAVGSLGPEFIGWAEERTGRPLRWWQRLVATRLLEVDDEERLVWETLVMSMARQLGKSWLLRELCLWRIHQEPRFGEPQDVLHTGKDLAVCKEIQRPARVWAKSRRDLYRVREVNGQEEIELLENGSRWMLRAKEACYGYSVSMGAADEAWKVRASSVEEGLTPTMTEREQSQLLLVSTAHRMATSLMLGRRQVALADLEVGDGDLLIEWSTPAEYELDDVAGWRLASPHWTSRRERMIAKRLEMARSGEAEGDPDEPDPIESFQAQWLNRWPRRRVEPRGATEDLLPAGLWAELAEPLEATSGPVYVAIEDDYGVGAAVAACARLEDGRLELDGWLCPDWDSAIGDVERLAVARPIRGLLVGASLLDRVPAARPLPRPQPAGGTLTRVGLALLRDLAQGGGLVHDQTTYELDEALRAAQVREAPTGLHLTARGPTHLVRAAVWAVGAAHKPAPVPAIR